MIDVESQTSVRTAPKLPVATTLGPVLVTPDELGDLRLEMVARVNGEERSRGNLGDLHWPWEELVAATQQRRERGLLAEGPQHLHLRGHAGHHRVGREEQQARVVTAHAAGVHLGLEEPRRPVDERLQPP